MIKKKTNEEIIKELPKKPPLMRFTIVDLSGLTVFHRSFVSEVLDEVLFSGFSAAMIAFSRELGSRLFSIRMEGVNYFFQTKGDFIFVVGMYTRVHANSAKRFLRLIDELIAWDELEGYLNKAIYFQTEIFQEKAEQIILEFQIRFKHLIRT
ncbi:MAG: hypothetical protein H7641_03370 [Candidatus Heimdallarchaeota archaeon]|nr:hypothetical protein [Candidatus Heimdallarchaeota archaeon]MCK4876601.1 hypothetical protein [Candidatus Heimdallarchaeota archaeon]